MNSGDKPASSETVATTHADGDDGGAAELPATFDRPLGPFELGRELGRGGMGRVLAARDRALDRPVAIKLVLSEHGDDLARFEREVRITARLEHPGIVPIHEAGRDAGGRPYYVMRRIAGVPLATRIAEARDVRARLALVENVLAAVDAAAYAHGHRVVHRDIKPANILVGEYGATTLIDWGLARRTDEGDGATDSATTSAQQLTHVGSAYGTPGYMAPEQARGEVVDARADVFALGMTLLHVLLGAPAFTGSVVEWIERAAGDLALPLARIPDEVPRELVAIVAKATAMRAEDRYADAGALAVDLRTFLAGGLVAAHRYTLRQRALRYVRTHRAPFAVVALLAIAAVVATVVALLGIVERRRSAERDATAADQRAVNATIAQAIAEVATDPARAIALLRTVPPSPAVRDVAAAAVRNGIPHGTRIHSGKVTVLAISPDGASLASGGADGILAVSELATGATRVLARFRSVDAGAWVLGGTALAVQTPGGMYVVDVRTGAARRIDTTKGSVRQFVIANGESVRYLDDRRHEVREAALRTGTVETLAQGVGDVACDGDLCVMLGSDRLRLLDGRREIWLSPGKEYSTGYTLAAVSRSARRAAVLVGGKLLEEWNLATNEVKRLELPARAIAYDGESLLVGGNGALWRVRPGTATPDALEARGTGDVHLGRTAVGAVGVMQDGAVVRFQGDRPYSLNAQVGGIVAITAQTTNDIVAVGTRTGLVLWWNLATVFPNAYTLPYTTLLWFDEKTLYVIRDTSLLAVDRRTHEVRELAQNLMYSALTGPAAVLGHRLVGRTAFGPAILDLETLDLRIFQDTSLIRIDRVRQAFAFTRDRKFVELGADGTEQVLWTGPAEIIRHGFGGSFLVVDLGHGLTRVDLATGTERVVIAEPVDDFFVTPSGDVWYSFAGVLSRWRDGLAIPLQTVEPGDALDEVDGVPLLLTRDGRMLAFDGEQFVVRATYCTSMTRIGVSDIVLTHESTGAHLHFMSSGAQSKIVKVGERVAAGAAYRSFAMGESPDIHIFDDDVPDDPTALTAWLTSATNAVLDTRSGAVIWPRD